MPDNHQLPVTPAIDTDAMSRRAIATHNSIHSNCYIISTGVHRSLSRWICTNFIDRDGRFNNNNFSAPSKLGERFGSMEILICSFCNVSSPYIGGGIGEPVASHFVEWLHAR